MKGQFNNIKIQGISAAVPQYIEDNTKYKNVFGAKRVKKQIRITGVEKRRVSSRYQRASDLSYAAAKNLLNKLQWNKDEIKILINITQSPNYAHPSTAFFLHKRLGLKKECLSYDMNLGCSSFNVGVHTVASLLQQCNVHDKALLLLGDVAGQVRDPEAPLKPDDIAHDMLFGTAGAAIAIEKVEDNNLYYMNNSDGNGFDAIIGHWGRPSNLNGTEVFSFAINDVSSDLLKFKKEFGIEEESIDYYVFHQAQALILDSIIDTCGISAEKELRSLVEYGNTSGASVAVTLCANIERLSKMEKAKLLLCGFGVGLSWGYIYTEIDTDKILPIIECDEHYDEDKNPAAGMHDQNILIWNADSIMGEWIGRYNNGKSATVILAGEDEEKLKEIQSDLYLSSYYCKTTNDEEGFEQIIKFFGDNDMSLDAVVFPIAITEKNLQCFAQKLSERKNATKKVNVVVIDSVVDDALLQKEKKDLEEELNTISSIENGENLRINGILYKESQMDIVQILHDGQEWIDMYFEKECPDTMKNPIYIAKVQQFLLSANAKYISNQVLVIEAKE